VRWMGAVTRKGNSLWYGGKRLGAASALYCYPGEEAHLGTSEGVVVCATPARIDLLFVAGEKVVGCEVKTVGDLVSSHRSRRLHRQLRTLRETTDISALVLRGGLGVHSTVCAWGALEEEVDAAHPKPDEFWGDWLNWQTQGVYILPVTLECYLPRLLVYKRALATTGSRVLFGTDLRPPRERQPGWLLRRIPGIGPDRSQRLINLYGSSIAALQAALAGDVGSTLGKAVEDKLCQAAKQ